LRNTVLALAVTAVFVSPAPAGEIWLSITEPREGSSAVGEIEIAAEVLAVDEIAAVEFSVDGILVGKLSSAPYRLPVDLGPENIGHRITLRATDRDDSAFPHQRRGRGRAATALRHRDPRRRPGRSTGS
jgi:hypothetical protein